MKAADSIAVGWNVTRRSALAACRGIFLGMAKDSKERMEVMKRADRLLDERLQIAVVSGTLPSGG
jgi:hypothetical protein